MFEVIKKGIEAGKDLEEKLHIRSQYKSIGQYYVGSKLEQGGSKLKQGGNSLYYNFIKGVQNTSPNKEGQQNYKDLQDVSITEKQKQLSDTLEKKIKEIDSMSSDFINKNCGVLTDIAQAAYKGSLKSIEYMKYLTQSSNAQISTKLQGSIAENAQKLGEYCGKLGDDLINKLPENGQKAVKQIKTGASMLAVLSDQFSSIASKTVGVFEFYKKPLDLCIDISEKAIDAMQGKEFKAIKAFQEGLKGNIQTDIISKINDDFQRQSSDYLAKRGQEINQLIDIYNNPSASNNDKDSIKRIIMDEIIQKNIRNDKINSSFDNLDIANKKIGARMIKLEEQLFNNNNIQNNVFKLEEDLHLNVVGKVYGIAEAQFKRAKEDFEASKPSSEELQNKLSRAEKNFKDTEGLFNKIKGKNEITLQEMKDFRRVYEEVKDPEIWSEDKEINFDLQQRNQANIEIVGANVAMGHKFDSTIQALSGALSTSIEALLNKTGVIIKKTGLLDEKTRDKEIELTDFTGRRAAQEKQEFEKRQEEITGRSNNDSMVEIELKDVLGSYKMKDAVQQLKAGLEDPKHPMQSAVTTTEKGKNTGRIN